MVFPHTPVLVVVLAQELEVLLVEARTLRSPDQFVHRLHVDVLEHTSTADCQVRAHVFEDVHPKGVLRPVFRQFGEPVRQTAHESVLHVHRPGLDDRRVLEDLIPIDLVVQFGIRFELSSPAVADRHRHHGIRHLVIDSPGETVEELRGTNHPARSDRLVRGLVVDSVQARRLPGDESCHMGVDASSASPVEPGIGVVFHLALGEAVTQRKGHVERIGLVDGSVTGSHDPDVLSDATIGDDAIVDHLVGDGLNDRGCQVDFVEEQDTVRAGLREVHRPRIRNVLQHVRLGHVGDSLEGGRVHLGRASVVEDEVLFRGFEDQGLLIDGLLAPLDELALFLLGELTPDLARNRGLPDAGSTTNHERDFRQVHRSQRVHIRSRGQLIQACHVHSPSVLIHHQSATSASSSQSIYPLVA